MLQAKWSHVQVSCRDAGGAALCNLLQTTGIGQKLVHVRAMSEFQHHEIHFKHAALVLFALLHLSSLLSRSLSKSAQV